MIISSDNSKEKTLLLIVIRDFVGTTPLENLSTTLKADLEKIWNSLSKVKVARNVIEWLNTDISTMTISLKASKIVKLRTILISCLLVCLIRSCCPRNLIKKWQNFDPGKQLRLDRNDIIWRSQLLEIDSRIPKTQILFSVLNIINAFQLMVISCMLRVFGIKSWQTKILIYLHNKNYWLNIDVMKYLA